MRPPSVPRRLALLIAAVVVVVGPSCSNDDDPDATPSTVRSTIQEQRTDPSGPNATTTEPDGEPGAAVLDELLRRAVSEERNAEATYRAVIAQLGDVRPFTNIAESEAQHVAALEGLAERYGVDVDDLVAQAQEPPTTRTAACELGVAAEEADVALYDELLPQVQGYPDVVQVLTNLRRASLEEHLPAFERCS